MPNIEVHKYGGTSLSSFERIQAIALKTQAYQVEHNVQVVLVLSAMGDATDKLMNAAYALSKEPDLAALDVLLSVGEQQSCALMAIALKALGLQARVYSGGAAGLYTDACHGQAKIESVEVKSLQHALQVGVIPVVTGYQGVSPQGQVTTLGRGGSDLTAVVLAHALSVRCLIYTDVEGVYTADPRVIEGAKQLPMASMSSMLLFSELGAQVMQPLAVEYALNHQVSLSIHAAQHAQSEGTRLSISGDHLECDLRGVVIDSSVTEIHLTHVEDEGALNRLLQRFRLHGVCVDLLGTAVYAGQVRCWVMVLQEAHHLWCLEALNAAGIQYTLRTGLSRVSLVFNPMQALFETAERVAESIQVIPLRRLNTAQRLTYLVEQSEALILAQQWHDLLMLHLNKNFTKSEALFEEGVSSIKG